MKNKKIIHFITDAAIFSAVGFILDFLQGTICNFLPFWPNGGSVGFAMCAVFIICFKYGLKGLFVGFLIGILSMMGGVWISPFADNFFKTLLQLFLDYFGAWTVVGLAGIFTKQIKNAVSAKGKVLWVSIAVMTGTIARFLCHFTAGMLFWPNEDVTSQFIYAFAYNASYCIPSGLICLAIMLLLVFKMPKMMEENQNEK